MKCPYCGQTAQLKDSAIIYGKSYGMAWICKNYPKCDSYVGTHKNSKDFKPLGRMANAQLREWKIRAHDAFDNYWRGRMTRSAGYRELAKRLNMPIRKAHIAMFDVKDCKRVVEAFTNSLF